LPPQQQPPRSKMQKPSDRSSEEIVGLFLVSRFSRV
jgi:hypothetical protein